ncbi:hypothetical protein AB0N09_11120 [Streptomyces erythrochromogenes]|uniref:hypothetical protein n=1 Tax=Streptomyces erythrochromogenes TaxID=285574 RepID=UPI003448AB2D
MDGSLNAAPHLDPPVRLDLGPAGPVDATTVHRAVDHPPALTAALRAAGLRRVPPPRQG